ncbi:hypothetical protein U3A55_00820 [Salarchaeum sp. III]|uniref:hypothetical protein n=1 Tax=Salarchaeum sp. III TaxID=3107927 RepID=UPI002ED7B640
MVAEGGLPNLFADYSVLVEYCATYFEEQPYAERVIDEYSDEGGCIVVGQEPWRALNHQLSNRKRLWNHLIKQATEFDRDEEKDKRDFRADILNYSSLQSALDFDLSKGYLPDIEELRSDLDEMTLAEFREMLDDVRIQGNTQRRELEEVKSPEEYERGGQSVWTSRTALSQYAPTDANLESLIDAGFWCMENNGPVLVSSNGDIIENKEDVEDELGRISNNSVDIHTPKGIVDRTTIFN